MKAANPTVTISPDQEKKLIHAIQKFIYVSQMKYVTGIKGREGFVRAYQVLRPGHVLERPILGREQSTVNFYKIFKRLCHSKFTDEEVDTIMEKANEMIRLWKVNGRLTVSAMDDLGICRSSEYKVRDNLCLAQQGPVCLTHDETRARELAWSNRKEIAAANKDREIQENMLLKKRKLAKQILDKEEQDTKAKADSDAAKAAEKLRRSTLTKEQKKAEDDAKKASNKEKMLEKSRVRKEDKERKMDQARRDLL